MIALYNYISAYLLTKEEYYDILKTVPNVPLEQSCYWWLNPGYEYIAVAPEGDVCVPQFPEFALGVRPVLNVVGYAAPGTKVKVGVFMGTVINNFQTDEGLPGSGVLTDTPVCLHEIADIHKFMYGDEFRSMITPVKK